MTILHAFSSILQADERAVINPKCCPKCARFYNAKGEFVRTPFIVANLSLAECPECYPKRLEAARRDGRAG